MTEVIKVSRSIITANSYLIHGRKGDVLIDPGESMATLRQILAMNRSIRFILLTHGHYDHVKNVAAISKAFGADIAMHSADLPLLLPSVKPIMHPKGLMGALMNGRYINQPDPEPFIPCIRLSDGMRLERFGLEGMVVHLPGHTKGSVGFLLTGDRCCIVGDLLINLFSPTLMPVAEDHAILKQSLLRLLTFDVETLMPGHGKSFTFKELLLKNKRLTEELTIAMNADNTKPIPSEKEKIEIPWKSRLTTSGKRDK